jgi:hypothetical protein
LNWLNEILKREKGCSRHWAECAATLGRGALGAELRACCQSRLTGADRAALGEEGATGLALALLSHVARARRLGAAGGGAPVRKGVGRGRGELEEARLVGCSPAGWRLNSKTFRRRGEVSRRWGSEWRERLQLSPALVLRWPARKRRKR